MKRWPRLPLLTLFILFFAGCQNEPPPTPAPRTYYESLDLATAESAVQEFVAAFQRDDYETLYLIFSVDAQIAVTHNMNGLAYDELMTPPEGITAQEIMAEIAGIGAIGDLEHMTGAHMFDTVMLAVKKHNAFSIDLRGEVTIEQTKPWTFSFTQGADVLTRVAGIEGTVTFIMVQAPSGRWRVQQVIVPGGDKTQIPWSIPQP
ncbi:MAG: hypothetical protein OT477_08525 [Chloroflexi bacterium]|nr:hypothetical protein [Chloroflexota bacterium]